MPNRTPPLFTRCGLADEIFEQSVVCIFITFKAVLWLVCNTVLAALILVSTAAYLESSAMCREPCHMNYPSDGTVEWECRTLHSGETLETLFGEQWVAVARFNRLDRRHIHAGLSIKVPKQIDDVEYFSPLPLLYLAAEQDKRFILINLTRTVSGCLRVRHSLVCRADRFRERPR